MIPVSDKLFEKSAHTRDLKGFKWSIFLRCLVPPYDHTFHYNEKRRRVHTPPGWTPFPVLIASDGVSSY